MIDNLAGEKSGLKSVVAEGHDPEAAPPGCEMVDAEQMALLPLCESKGRESAENEVAEGRGPGRPPGSKNKSTAAWRDFLLSRYPSPLVGLAEVAFRPMDQLAKDLGASMEGLAYKDRKELLQMQLQCMKELAPYLHQKQPLAVENTGGGLMTLVINSGTASADDVAGAGIMDAEFIDPESQENQGFTGGNLPELDAKELDAPCNALEEKENRE